MPQATPDKTYTYLALGDSYTIGEKVPPTENFPNRVVTLLNNRGYNFQPPQIVAKTGWTTGELQGAIKNARLAKHYDFVSLLIGVNNQYRELPIGGYSSELQQLLLQAIHFAGNDPSHVIVLSIPDWSVTPFAEGRDRNAISGEIAEYNMVNRRISTTMNVQYIDITPGTIAHGSVPGMLAEDGLHPSGKEYEIWASHVVHFIIQAL